MRILLATLFILGIGLALIVSGVPGVSAYSLWSPAASYTKDGAGLPEVSARAWGIYDTETGQMLFGRDVDSVYPIASVTKLMTAEVALGTFSLEATTTVSHSAVATEGRAGALSAGEVYSVRELMFPLLLSSSNDAAEVIAEYGNREAFIRAMNETARKLGMTNTAYDDPSGLSAGNTSSVVDLAKLMVHLSRDRRYLLDVSRLPKYVGTHAWRNVNRVAAVLTFRGGKHGYTDEAGRTLAALFDKELSLGGARTFTIILLGSADLMADIGTLHTFLRDHVAYR